MATEPEFVLDGDVIAPRRREERYRIYRVRDGGALELVATCRTQGSVGVTLCTLGAEGEFLDYCVGLLDSMDHKDSNGRWVGKWLILPWQEAKAEIWSLEEEMIAEMISAGLARQGEDGLFEFTTAGEEWLNRQIDAWAQAERQKTEKENNVQTQEAEQVS